MEEISTADWQQRVKTERDELCQKLAKLRSFRLTAAYAAIECGQRGLLEQQESVMTQYADILNARIAQFK